MSQLAESYSFATVGFKSKIFKRKSKEFWIEANKKFFKPQTARIMEPLVGEKREEKV